MNFGQTIFLCVWQAIHLNIPPPGEPPYKQILRRVGWSILAIIAPEVVALNAWLQYRSAERLMNHVNQRRGLTQKKVDQAWSKWAKGHLLWLGSQLGMLCISPIGLADYIRMIVCHRPDLRNFKSQQRRSMNDDLLSRLDADQLPWTMDTACYALSGGAVLVSDYGMGETLSSDAIALLADESPTSLLLLQKAVLQDPSKASGLAKIITCTQALWFCSQCISRLGQDMAISLLELNTFAHCVSALCIYGFWWHKPYDVQTHVYINNLWLYQHHLLMKAASPMFLPKYRHWLPIAVEERTTSGDLVTLLDNIDPNIDNPVYVDGPEPIPGTGFMLRAMRYFRSRHTSDAYLVYWKQLWKIRVSCHHSNLPKSPEKSGQNCLRRIRNMESSLYSALTDQGFFVPLIMTLTFSVYGGIHLLAWQYHFPTTAESIMWRSASIATASSGLVILSLNAAESLYYKFDWKYDHVIRNLGLSSAAVLASAAVVARSFLFIESFRALPNSPASIYEVLRWTTYVPHI